MNYSAGSFQLFSWIEISFGAFAQHWDNLRAVGRYMEDMANCKTRTHTPLLSPPPLLPRQTSHGTYLQVQVVGRHGNCWEWGLFALFLLSSPKPCHYPYSTDTHVYLYAPPCLIVRLCVRPPACLSESIWLCLYSRLFLCCPVNLCTLYPTTIHSPHLPLYLVHSWITSCICNHFVLHPLSINYIITVHSYKCIQ